MDIQDKLSVRHVYSNTTRIIDLSRIEDQTVLFEFNEYETIEISLHSENYAVNLECLCYKQGDEIFSCDKSFDLENDEEFIISEGTDSDYVGYLPARYRITVTSRDGQQKDCFFNVTLNYEVTNEGMEKVVDQLEGFIRGLSVDYFKQAPGKDSSRNQNDFWIYEVLLREKNRIHYYSNRILNNFRMNIRTDYVPENLQQKQNAATIRKNCTRIHTTGQKYYNVKKVLSSDTDENILLKKYLVKLNGILKNIPVNLDEFYEEKQDQLQQLKREKAGLEQENEKKISHIFKMMNENHTKVLDEAIKDHENWCSKISGWTAACNQGKRNINMLLHSRELENLSLNNQLQYSSSFMNNRDYRYFMELVNKLDYNRNYGSGFSGGTVFRDKKSYELFELYGFILLNNILKEAGFTLVNEFEKNIFQFGSESVMTFENDHFHVDIYYDHYCPRRHSPKAGEQDIVTVNSTHCKPDYIVAVFDRQHQFKDMAVLDMKYRRLKKMIGKDENADYPSDVDDILTDYSQLEIKGLRKRPVMAGVIYPSRNEEIIRRYDGTYIGIDLMKDYDSSAGYQYLKKIILGLMK